MANTRYSRLVSENHSHQYETKNGYDPESFMSYVSEELLAQDDICYLGTSDCSMVS